MRCVGRSLVISSIQITFLCAAIPLLQAGCGGSSGCSSDSSCSAPTPRCNTSNSTCVACLPAADNCAKPTHCALTAGVYGCTTSCKADGECRKNGPATAACCFNQCADTSTDTANCGRCAFACPRPATAEVACVAGACAVKSCAAGALDCNADPTDGCEVTPATDVKNCGACGTACKSGPNSTTACQDGKCVLTCSAGHADCNANPADGCEVDITSDLANCGGCAMACGPLAHATAACVASTCTVASCNGGFGDCNKVAADGCELDLSSNINNCGACGTACKPVPNADVSCGGGMCAFACKPGFSDCNGDPSDGCEVAVAMDANNCGMCGNRCVLAHANAKCVQSACAIDSCQMGFGDCDGKAANGCEVPLISDVNNCGMCGTMCGKDINNNVRLCKAGMCTCAACSYPNAKTKCVVADCVFDMCNAGFGDCNKNLKDGCEADLLNDDNNCGACANPCGKGNFCDMGVCKPNPCKGKVGGHILMAQGRPYLGYCWYLGTGGSSGDDVCADAGGVNKGNDAINVLMDDCVGGAAGQPSQWFYDNGNAEGWLGPYVNPPTGYRTLGHGYTNGSGLGRKQAYVGRCNMGGIANVGAFPGEINDTKSPGGANPDNNCRSVVVACDH